MKKTSPHPEAADPAPAKPKLLLVGEGPQDVGREDAPGGALAGFLHAALVGPREPVDHHELPFEIASIRLWRRIALIRAPGRRQSLREIARLKPDGERVRAAMVLAATAGYHGVVVLRDCEEAENINLGETLRQAREVHARREAASEEPRPALVIAAPSRCHETWLLADREAVCAVLEEGGLYHFSGDAEVRPHCDDLKAHIQRQADRLHRANHEVRRALAFRARPAELRNRCARCYPPFQQDVETELRARFGLPGAPRPGSGGGKRRGRGK